MADFFVKLKEQIGAGITTVTTKSRVAVETTRLRRQMRKLVQEKKGYSPARHKTLGIPKRGKV